MKAGIGKKVNKLLDLTKTDKGYIVAVGLALVFVCFLFVVYSWTMRPVPNEYITMYWLPNPQNQTSNLPELLILNQNNTFNVWFNIESHMIEPLYCQVRVKVTDDYTEFPVDPSENIDFAYNLTSSQRDLAGGETWEIGATVTINEPGDFLAVFELWVEDETVKKYEFYHKMLPLSLEVVEAI